MKVLELKSNQSFSMQERTQPELAPGYCRISVKFAGVCSSDISRSQAGEAYHYPLVLGHEFSGTVLKTAPDVLKIRPGQRVGAFPLLPCFRCEMCLQQHFAQCSQYTYLGSRVDGAFAEFVDVPEWNLLPIPESVKLVQAAMLEPCSVIYNAIQKSKILHNQDPAKKILVLGAGFLGLILGEMLKLLRPNSNVTFVDRNQFKLDLAKPFSTAQINITDLEKLKEFDSVFEVTGAPQFFAESIRLCKPLGTLIWIGNIQSDLTLPKKAVSAILRKELNIKGVWNSVYNPSAATDDWREVLKLFGRGFDPASLISRSISLSEVPEILHQMHLHKSGAANFQIVKIMVQNGSE